jgi:hypothetical protein
MNYKPKTGDLVLVESNSHPEKITVLILNDGEPTCNSDGEEWWTEWKGKNLKTDRWFNVSSRHHKFEKIN